MAEISRIDNEITAIKSRLEKLEGAFIKDEEGLIDFSGHKIFHRETMQAKEELKKKKSDIIKSVLEWMAIAAATIILSHILPMDASIISNIPK